MSKFDLYDLIGKLAAAATQKKEQPHLFEKESSPAPESAKTEPSPDKKPFGADKAAIVEMLRRHDQKSREIDERIKKSEEEKNRP